MQLTKEAIREDRQCAQCGHQWRALPWALQCPGCSSTRWHGQPDQRRTQSKARRLAWGRMMTAARRTAARTRDLQAQARREKD
jgi:hypothetical protein